jgi:hypothetical protein
MKKKVSRRRPYDLIKDLLNKRGSGKGDLSARSEEILTELFKQKRLLTLIPSRIYES